MGSYGRGRDAGRAEDVALIDSLPKEIDSPLLSEVLNADLAKPIDEPDRGRDHELTGVQGMRDRVFESSKRNLTTRDFWRSVIAHSAIITFHRHAGCCRCMEEWSAVRRLRGCGLACAGRREEFRAPRPNYSVAGCFTMTTAAPHCARTLVSTARASARGARFATNEGERP